MLFSFYFVYLDTINFKTVLSSPIQCSPLEKAAQMEAKGESEHNCQRGVNRNLIYAKQLNTFNIHVEMLIQNLHNSKLY